MKKIIGLTCTVLMAVGLLACGSKNKKNDNEKTALVMSTDELSGIFSTFYGTAGADTSIAGMTQISMLTSTPDGKPKYGDDEAVVVKDMSQRMYDRNGNLTEQGEEKGKTIYQFILKNNILFSDGTPLTIHDVLFNLYVYLDPVYTGSSTLYSTKIKGLKEYRTQSYDIGDETNDQFEQTFRLNAEDRLDTVITYVTDKNHSLNAEEIANAKKDIEQLKVYFKDELKSNWTGAVEDLENSMKQYNVTKSWQMFLLSEGILQLKRDNLGNPIKTNGKFDLDLAGFSKENYTEDECVNLVYEHYIGKDSKSERIELVLAYYNSGNLLYNDLVAEYKSEYFDSIKENGELLVKNISGITVAKGSKFVGEKTYTDEYDVLQIEIEGVDPKAIWNFGFSVAPMHYYSDQAHTSKAMSADVYSANCQNFGVELGDVDWFQNNVKAKNAIPMGAGPYKMSLLNGINDNTTLEDYRTGFFKDNIVYFERNEHFMMGKPIIKYLRYKEVNSSNIMNAIVDGSIAFATPTAKQENIKIINENKNLESTMTMTSGYGYIGINPKYIKEVEVRRAIMHSMDLALIKDYYPGDLSKLIARPMSLVSWVYNNNDGSKWEPKATYAYNSNKAELTATIDDLVQQAGYKKGANGKWSKTESGKTTSLKYTFTIAGSSEDHPAYAPMLKASNFLNEIGWETNVKTDSRALSKLANGGLAVWAAAWGSTIDPDMYQVYHVDSKASSVLNWGYDFIKKNQDTMSFEYDTILALSDLIDQGRSTLEVNARTKIYQDALNMIMELAVELPTYQRNDLYVYNSDIIDVSTLVAKEKCTPFYGPLSEIWKVSLNIK